MNVSRPSSAVASLRLGSCSARIYLLLIFRIAAFGNEASERTAGVSKIDAAGRREFGLGG